MRRLLRASLGLALCAGLAGVWAGMPGASPSGSVSYSVFDTDDKPVVDAVVRLSPVDTDAGLPAASEEKVIDQYRQAYEPLVTVMTVGSAVRFKNSDPFGHHVYSFSQAKQFEFRQPTRGTTDPLLLDKPGLIALGCNIHDHMLAYIFVSDSPNVAISDSDGKVQLASLAPGTYTATIWHPRLKGDPIEQEIIVTGSELSAQVSLDLKPPRRVRKSSYSGDR